VKNHSNFPRKGANQQKLQHYEIIPKYSFCGLSGHCCQPYGAGKSGRNKL
jgi:hypothetical protein